MNDLPLARMQLAMSLVADWQIERVFDSLGTLKYAEFKEKIAEPWKQDLDPDYPHYCAANTTNPKVNACATCFANDGGITRGSFVKLLEYGIQERVKGYGGAPRGYNRSKYFYPKKFSFRGASFSAEYEEKEDLKDPS